MALLYSLIYAHPLLPDPVRAVAGDLIFVDDVGATVAPLTIEAVDQGAPIGPTVYTIGDPSDPRMAFRVDTPSLMTSLPGFFLPDAGSLAIAIGFAGGSVEAGEDTFLKVLGACSFTAFISGGYPKVRYELGPGPTMTANNISAAGWKTVVFTWDATAGVRSFFVNGTIASTINGPVGLDQEGVAIAPSLDYTGPGAISLSAFQFYDHAFSASDAAAFHAAQTADIADTPPLVDGRSVDGSITLHWDDPPVPITGWVMRIASPALVQVHEVKLGPEARELTVTTMLPELVGVVGVVGVAHLYAVNESGWSTPAEVVF